MISALSIEELNHGTGKVHNGPAIAAAVLQAQRQGGTIEVPIVVKSPNFKSACKNAKCLQSKGDGVIFVGQTAPYGTAGKDSEFGFNETIIMGVGLLHGEQKDTGSEIDLTKSNLVMSAGIRIDQKRDTGKKKKGEYKDPKDRANVLTDNTPMKFGSVVEVIGDSVAIASRTHGLRLIGGFGARVPGSGGPSGAPDKDNIGAVGGGVKLMSSNYDAEILNDPKHEFGLQPLVKGFQLEQALKDIVGRTEEGTKIAVSDQKDSEFGFAELCKAVNLLANALRDHTHVGYGGGQFGAVYTFPSEVAVAGSTLTDIVVTTSQVKRHVNGVLAMLKKITQRYNQAATRLNKSIISVGYINSRGNFTT